MLRIYVDTNVYRDLFEGRKDKFRDLGEMALFAFRQVRLGKYVLVVSDWNLDELHKYGFLERAEKFLSDFPQSQIIRIETTPEDRKKAREMSRNYTDALHVVLALKSNCLYFITRDNDYAEFQNLIEIIFPETL